MKKSSLIVSLAASAALVLPLSLLADHHEEEAPPPLADVWKVIVKEGMEAEFAEAVASHMKFRKDAGESREWNAYRVAAGHNITPIEYYSCCFNWADLDANEAEDQALGLSANWNENVGQYVDHYHHYIERNDWENSYFPEESTGGPYYGVTSWTVKAGGGPASDQAMEKMSQLAINDGWAGDENNWFWTSRVVGDDVLMLISSYKNYADMEPPEQSFFEFAVEKLGEEEAGAMFKDFSSGFSDSDYTIWVHDPSISTPSDEE